MKICDENLFSDNFEWSCKKLWKIKSADERTSEKQQEKNKWWFVSQRKNCDKNLFFR